MTDTVMVDRIPLQVKREEIWAHFGNERNGGGAIEFILYPYNKSDEKFNKALVNFKDSRVLMSLFLYNHQINGRELGIKPVYQQMFRTVRAEIDPLIVASINDIHAFSKELKETSGVKIKENREGAHIMSGTMLQILYGEEKLAEAYRNQQEQQQRQLRLYQGDENITNSPKRERRNSSSSSSSSLSITRQREGSVPSKQKQSKPKAIGSGSSSPKSSSKNVAVVSKPTKKGPDPPPRPSKASISTAMQKQKPEDSPSKSSSRRSSIGSNTGKDNVGINRPKSPGLHSSRSKSPGPPSARSKSPGPGTNRPKSPGPVTNRPKSPGPSTLRPKSPGPIAKRPKSPKASAEIPKSPTPYRRPSVKETLAKFGEAKSQKREPSEPPPPKAEKPAPPPKFEEKVTTTRTSVSVTVEDKKDKPENKIEKQTNPVTHEPEEEVQNEEVVENVTHEYEEPPRNYNSEEPLRNYNSYETNEEPPMIYDPNDEPPRNYHSYETNGFSHDTPYTNGVGSPYIEHERDYNEMFEEPNPTQAIVLADNNENNRNTANTRYSDISSFLDRERSRGGGSYTSALASMRDLQRNNVDGGEPRRMQFTKAYTQADVDAVAQRLLSNHLIKNPALGGDMGPIMIDDPNGVGSMFQRNAVLGLPDVPEKDPDPIKVNTMVFEFMNKHYLEKDKIENIEKAFNVKLVTEKVEGDVTHVNFKPGEGGRSQLNRASEEFAKTYESTFEQTKVEKLTVTTEEHKKQLKEAVAKERPRFQEMILISEGDGEVTLVGGTVARELKEHLERKLRLNKTTVVPDKSTYTKSGYNPSEDRYERRSARANIKPRPARHKTPERKPHSRYVRSSSVDPLDCP